MTKFVNLTPHDVVMMRGDVERVVPASGKLARVSCEKIKVGEVEGFPILETVWGEVEGLPQPESGTIYIVSSIVAARCPDRDDVLIPDDTVRDDKGRIIGARALGRV